MGLNKKPTHTQHEPEPVDTLYGRIKCFIYFCYYYFSVGFRCINKNELKNCVRVIRVQAENVSAVAKRISNKNVCYI